MITYKLVTADDIDALVACRLEFIDDIKKTHIDDPALADNLHAYFRETIPSGKFISWAAMDGNEMIATSGLCFHQTPPNASALDGSSAYIMNMYTKPAYRKRGIANELFSRILEEARKLGYKKVSLNASEMGVGLYRKYGFKEPDMIELVKFFP